MKAYTITIIAIVLLVLVTAVIVVKTTAVPDVSLPCRLVHCNVDSYGIYQNSAEQIGATPQGEAVCHCPLDSPDHFYYVPYGSNY